MRKSEKSHDTGLRILEVLKILLNEEVTKNEIINKLKNNGHIGDIYTQEAFLKYFNTFEHSGLKLKKDKAKYTFKNAILEAKLTQREQKILLKLIGSIDKLHNKKSEDTVKNIMMKLGKYIGMDLEAEILKIEEENKLSLDKNIRANVITTLKNMLYDNHKVTITYRKPNNTTETITVILKEILEHDNKFYVICYNSVYARNRRINIDSIIEMKQLPNKAAELNPDSVVFEIYGRLSSAYKLKPYETVINFGKNRQTISNTEEDKDSLLLRLLKYGENCKIITPLSLRQEFLDLTDKILYNLEASKCQE